ncbi:MAG: glycosyltransferase family 2 protein [Myxococcota bacterium]|nr:glycosyltransferase family 2 protein [Myxococcota bacterium]
MAHRDASLSEPVVYTAGVINYQNYDDLLPCLESLQAQTLSPAQITVVDADPDESRLAAIEDQFPTVAFERVRNHGYAGGANRLLALLGEAVPEAEFSLVLNPDTFLEPDFCEVLLHSIQEREDVALAGGKLFRSGRSRLDSAGIRLPLNRRPRDRGSRQTDRGQFDRAEYVFGASGAAMMIRLAALSDLEIDGEIFDEDFFVYHEDTDLSWRAHNLGWRVYYEPAAVAVHKRGWQKESRYSIPAEIRRHSFKNHYLQIVKNESLLSFLVLLPVFLVWETLRFGFALLLDRRILPAYAQAYQLMGRAFRKRRILRAKMKQSKRR